VSCFTKNQIFRLCSLSISVFVSSCVEHEPNGIHNSKLRDRVIACGAGFSQDLQASLEASLKKTALRANTTAGFKEDVKVAIFNTVPAKDRLEAYQNYIRCIDKKGNAKKKAKKKKEEKQEKQEQPYDLEKPH